ncbi:MAG: amidohydrolase family protein [Candidatus Latescibacteria bacterium]|nr:amidohydrolase family protein [Candidatus Latescibacterota bacterium]
MSKHKPQTVDLLVTNGTLITMDVQRRIYARGAVAVQDGVIAAVGPAAQIEGAYQARRVIDAGGGVVHPGFVDAHVHLSQHLGRGTIPDNWPEEREHDQWLPYWTQMEEEDAYCSALLAGLEMVRNGTTTCCDNGGRFEAELNAGAMAEVGLRCMVGEVCWDRPPKPGVGVGDTAACLARLERLLRRFQKNKHSASSRRGFHVDKPLG